MNLTEEEIKEYLSKHLPYRLNCMRAYDLYIKMRSTDKYGSEKKELKCLWGSEFLDPAFEISIVFGRSLLNFLGIKKDGQSLKNFEQIEIKNSEKDDIFIWNVNPGKSYYPIGNIKPDEQIHLLNLLKVANKSVAHLTIKYSTDSELESLHPARDIIYKLMLEYVEGLDKEALWLHNMKTRKSWW